MRNSTHSMQRATLDDYAEYVRLNLQLGISVLTIGYVSVIVKVFMQNIIG